MEGAPKIVRKGLAKTVTYVFPLPEDKDHGLIIELNAQRRVLGSWTIAKGNAYRITPHRVRRMPLIENDPDTIRRFCRLNGIPLTRIQRVARGEKIEFLHPLCQGDDGLRGIAGNEPPVKIVGCHTTGNPEYEWKILVVEGEEPKTWEAFCTIAQNWTQVKEGEYHL